MFEKIGDILPGYAEYYERVVQRWTKITATDVQRTSYDIRRMRIFKALSYVYADVVQFCQEACKIFSAKKGGVSPRIPCRWQTECFVVADLSYGHSIQSYGDSRPLLEAIRFQI
jgi:hypothetical protein